MVLAADTIVVSLSGQILEKPRSEADHIAMLKMLRSSGYHRVYTAVVAMAPLASAQHPGYATESTVEDTTVRFGQDISDEMLLAYVRTYVFSESISLLLDFSFSRHVVKLDVRSQVGNTDSG